MNLINRLWRRPPARQNAEKLYGAIVAQARLPQFYTVIGVPDTLEGRFLMLSMHYAVLMHRLKREGGSALPLAQELSDLFTADMDTVLREIGVSDLRVPKKVRALSAANHGFAIAVERGLSAEGDTELIDTLAVSLPLEEGGKAPVARALSHYLRKSAARLAAQPFDALAKGGIAWPEVTP